MIFKRPVERYGQSPQADTPYHRAGQLWDERIGSARVQAHNWRLMALGGLCLSSAMAAALVWESLQSRVTPYVVAVDRLGEAQAVTPAQADYRPDDAQIAWALARFIGNVRSVALDPIVIRKNWLEAYDFASPKAAVFLGDFARSSDPFGKIGEKSVAVEVSSVIRASDTSFQIKWVETRYERSNVTAIDHWTAILGIKTRTPTTADVLRKNPLGIYVDAISWSREFDGSAPQPRSDGQSGATLNKEAGAGQAGEAGPDIPAALSSPATPNPNKIEPSASERTEP
jgi:type IV secretion system protein VirB5